MSPTSHVRVASRILLLALILLSVASPAAADHCDDLVVVSRCGHDRGPETTTKPQARLTDEAMFSLSLINGERRKAGVAPLAFFQPGLDFAEPHTLRMAERETLEHNHRWLDDDTKDGYGADHITENVGTAVTVERIHELFMQSESHRANILDRRLTHVAIAVGADEKDWRYVTQDFLGFDDVAPATRPAVAPGATPGDSGSGSGGLTSRTPTVAEVINGGDLVVGEHTDAAITGTIEPIRSAVASSEAILPQPVSDEGQTSWLVWVGAVAFGVMAAAVELTMAVRSRRSARLAPTAV